MQKAFLNLNNQKLIEEIALTIEGEVVTPGDCLMYLPNDDTFALVRSSKVGQRLYQGYVEVVPSDKLIELTSYGEISGDGTEEAEKIVEWLNIKDN